MEKRAPRFDDLVAILGHAKQAHRSESRTGKIEMIGEVAEALFSDKTPSRDAALFVGGALLAWLTRGGSLEKDYFKVVKAKSHLTPSAIWRSIAPHQDERQVDYEPVICKLNHPKLSKKERTKK